MTSTNDRDTGKPGGSKLHLRRLARVRLAIFHTPPSKLLLIGYLSYILVGWVLLCLPVAQQVPASALDVLFIATSAVSTTGLVTVDPGGTFTGFGEGVILALIQMGGLGYMTIGSFATLSLSQRLTGVRARATRMAFNLPERIKPAQFVRSVVIFTFVAELAGAAALYFFFAAAGEENPLWLAVFHSVSAFCTAGFSLFPTSLEAYSTNVGVVLVISTLSILGSMGFLIVVDAWLTMTGRAHWLGFTSKVILRLTLTFIVVGSVLLFVVEPSIAGLPPGERLLGAFFQTVTATTTVGFNTIPIGTMSYAALMIFFFLMMIGASPAGTGGGLKTTSFAALVGLVRSTLKGRDEVRYHKRTVSQDRLQSASAAFAFYFAMLGIACFLLFLTEPGAAFDVVLFEAMSAMGTVGLSMGITGDLSSLGKLVVIVLMTAGRVGILTFGIALAAHDESREEEADNQLVL